MRSAPCRTGRFQGLPRLLGRLVPALLLAGCPADPGSGADAGESLRLYGTSCTTDVECVDGDLVFACDPVRRSCVCTDDFMCRGLPGTPYCNAFTGRCVADVAGCKSDAECSEGRFCDQSQRTCRDRKAWCDVCTLDDECGGPGDHCVAFPGSLSTTTYCASACGPGDTCPEGQACRDTAKGKQCMPAAGKCGAQPGQCIPDTGAPCATNEQCRSAGPEQVCDTLAGRCVAARTTCSGDTVCDPVDRTCVAKCRTNDECAVRHGSRDYICVNNACVRALTCASDADCPSSTQYCFKDPLFPAAAEGVCQPTCNADEECPTAEICQNDDSTARRRCIPGCRADDDCPLNAVCEGNQCVGQSGGAQRCQVKEVCGFREICRNTTCEKQPAHCGTCGGGCPNGLCVTLNYAAGCGNTTVPCSPKTCFYDPQNQLGCGGQQTCYCSMQRCVVSCASDAQCPNGFYCDRLATATTCSGFLPCPSGFRCNFGYCESTTNYCQPVVGDACATP